MIFELSGRGFEFVTERPYETEGERTRVVSQSSAIGDYPDAIHLRGSSFLWLGERHHLNREQVAELVKRMSNWLATGSLKIESDV